MLAPQRMTRRHRVPQDRPESHRGASDWPGRGWCRRRPLHRTRVRRPRGAGENSSVKSWPISSEPTTPSRTMRLPPAWCGKSSHARAARVRGKTTPLRRVSSRTHRNADRNCSSSVALSWRRGEVSSRAGPALPASPSGSSRSFMDNIPHGVALLNCNPIAREGAGATMWSRAAGPSRRSPDSPLV
jgi:hypothetical protein